MPPFPPSLRPGALSLGDGAAGVRTQGGGADWVVCVELCVHVHAGRLSGWEWRKGDPAWRSGGVGVRESLEEKSVPRGVWRRASVGRRGLGVSQHASCGPSGG